MARRSQGHGRHFFAGVNVTTPDPRIVEDLIARGVISLTRSARDANEETRQAIARAADWLYERARELRHG